MEKTKTIYLSSKSIGFNNFFCACLFPYSSETANPWAEILRDDFPWNADGFKLKLLIWGFGQPFPGKPEKTKHVINTYLILEAARISDELLRALPTREKDQRSNNSKIYIYPKIYNQ